MEFNPKNLNTEETDDDEDSTKSKKKKSGFLGEYVEKPKKPATKAEEKPVTDKTLETMTDEESRETLEVLVIDARNQTAEVATDLDVDPVLAAIDRFRSEILDAGADLDTAETITLAAIEFEGQEPEETAQPGPPEDSEDMHDFGEEDEVIIGEIHHHPTIEVATEAVVPLTPSTSRSRGTRVAVTAAASAAAAGIVAAPAAASSAAETVYEPITPATAAVVGGIVGFMLGKRSGRIKTEKRSVKVQEKLRDEVIDLKFKLQQKESNIRRAVLAVEKPKAISRKVESLPARSLEYEAKPVISKEAAPVHLGHMVVDAEKPKASESNPEKTKTEKQKVENPKIKLDKNIDTLNRTELLRMSEKIIINGSSLRQIYETRLIGEKGLRRLVKEHLGGGDVKRVLRREIVERELDFERDPALRDRDPFHSAVSGGKSSTLKQLIEHAAQSTDEEQEEIAFLKARAAHEEQERQKQSGQRRMVDMLLISSIVLLLVFVILLALKQR